MVVFRVENECFGINIRFFDVHLQSFKMSAMANKRMYEIAFVGLRAGVHEFSYELDNQFFKDKGAQDTENIEANVKLLLDKNTGFMLLKFIVGGKAEVSCDRCGNPLTADLWDEFNMVVKLTEDPEEMNNTEEDADVFYISRTESHINVEDWLYEFVMLSIPLQKMCGNDAEGHSLCNEEVLKKLEEMKAATDEHNANNIWKGLDKFKEN
jgi:uncharacterized metal-binding protein YceD (DUF177 family)